MSNHLEALPTIELREQRIGRPRALTRREEDVIRAAAWSGVKKARLARRFGVSRDTIHRIINAGWSCWIFSTDPPGAEHLMPAEALTPAIRKQLHKHRCSDTR